MSAAVIYGAKSTEDRHESIPGQLDACREMCAREGWTVVGEYSDEGFSAFSGNRGAGLAAAREHAARAARESSAVVMLVCRHSDRISRGAGDRPDASQALIEIWHESRRADVWLRSTSARDDRDLETSAGTASIGERNRADSERESEATRDGYDRARRDGKPLFGIVPDGYLLQRWYDSENRPQRRMIVDPDRKALWDLVWRLAADGRSVRAIVLELDRHGWKTAPRKRGQKPRPFDANRIRLALNNPVYAGLQSGRVHADDCNPARKPRCCDYTTEVVGPGNWPAYVPVEDFSRLQGERRGRSHVAARSKGGRPAIGYLLGNGLAQCSDCGSRMDCITDRYVRKDGTRVRRYVCRTHRERPQDCSALPVDAVTVDRLVLSGIDKLLADADSLRGQLLAGRRSEQDRLGREAHQAREEAVAAERAAERAESRYADALDDGDDDACEVLLAAASRKRGEARRATERADAALDALSSAGEQPEDEQATDALARVWQALSGRIQDAEDDVRQLNAALREWFDAFSITVPVPGTLWVGPMLSADAVARVMRDPGRFPYEHAVDSAGERFVGPRVLTASTETVPSPW